LARTTSVRPSGKFGMYYRDRKNPPSAKSPWLEKRVRGRMRRRPACGRRKDLGLVQSSQAACAEVHSLHAAVLKDRDLLNVRLPLSFGSHVRVADTVSEGRGLATNLAFRHTCTSLTQIEPASTSAGPIQSGSRHELYHSPQNLASWPGVEVTAGAKPRPRRFAPQAQTLLHADSCHLLAAWCQYKISEVCVNRQCNNRGVGATKQRVR
jgi:hypothetical protein